MRAAATIRSCAAMGSATLLAVGWGEVAYRYAPVSAISFPVEGTASVVVMTLAVIVPSVPALAFASGRSIACRLTSAGLASLAVFLMMSDAFRIVSPAAAVRGLLLVVPFLSGAGFLARQRAYLAASGSAGFYSTSVAMIYANQGTGWIGFGGARVS